MTSSSRREFIVEAREHLKNMRTALVHERVFAIRAARSSTGGDTMDSADLASEEFGRHVSIMLAERGSDRMVQIDYALRQIDEASYGECEGCGLEIIEPRLEVMPFTRHCRDCQRDHQREVKSRRPAGHIGQERFAELEPIGIEEDVS